MSMTNIRRIIHAALFTPTSHGWGLPILFWGKPGAGKTSVLRSITGEYGWLPFGNGLEILSPGERGEGAFGVTPMPDADGYISYPAPRWVQPFETSGEGVVVVDELTTAPPAIQAPMLGLLLDKRIGGAQLPPRVRLIGAANEVADAAGGWDLAPPTANRMGHLPWELPNESEWTEWLMSSVDEVAPLKEPAINLEKRVMNSWSPAWAKARGIVAGFVRANPAALHRQPAHGSPESSKAWPSHRSWESATRALASAQVHNMSEADGDLFAAAFIGTGTLGELVTYRAQADLPDPSDVLDGKVTFKPDFKRLDRTFAVLGSTASLISSGISEAGGATKAKKDTKLMKRFDMLLKLLASTSEGAVDLCWGPAKMIAKSGMHDASDDTKKLMRRLLPMINAVDGK
jgi:hypothetical protein